jgi:hypothetical protein
VSSFDFGAAADGTLRVFGEVANRGPVERVGTVRVTVTAGGETQAREATVTVSAGGTAEFEVGFDVTESAFADGGELDVELV